MLDVLGKMAILPADNGSHPKLELILKVWLMKKFFLLICMCFCLNGFSQTLSMLEEGRTWFEETWKYGLELYATSETKVCGDSVVNGVSYKKIYQTTHLVEPEIKNWVESVFLAREENGVMYYYVDNKEICYFDFNRKVGDTFLFEYDTAVLSGNEDSKKVEVYGVVENISAMETADGVSRKVFSVRSYVREVADGEEDVWEWSEYTFIEGIGEVSHSIAFNFGVLTTGGGVPKLVCVHDANGNHVYGSAQECVTSLHRVPEVLPEKHGFYDLHGHRWNAVPKKGIYIRNGRKYMMD